MTNPDPQHTTTMQRAAALHQAGRIPEAAALYRAILKSDPKNFDCLYRLGVAMAQGGQFEDAAKWLARALKVRPAFAQGHLDLGNAYARLGDLRKAGIGYRKALSLAPELAEARHNLGNVLHAMGEHQGALECFDAIVAHDPANAAAHFNRANVLVALGRVGEAVPAFEAALAAKRDFAEAANNLSTALMRLRRLDEALARNREALALRPDHPEYVNNAGMIQDEMGRFEEALAAYDRAIALRPDFAEAFYNRGETLRKMRRPEEALAAYDRALVLRPDYAEALNNRGFVLQDLRRWDEALAAYDRAIDLRPDYSNAIWNRAICRLMIGDFARAWDGFEERWGNRGTGLVKQRFAPEWDGRGRPGSLLVLNEQGVGDEVFCAGMLNDLTARGLKVTARIDRRLLPLFGRSFPGIAFFSGDLPAGQRFDAQIYMGSLCRHLRRSEAEITNAAAPYLRADPARATRLRERHCAGAKLVCGLSWVSKGGRVSSEKSLALAMLAPLLELPGTVFVDLQYGDTRAEQAELRARTGLALATAPEIDNFNDLDGLAALIAACDVVVTVSNTTAHLAAALGKPTFVLLSYAPGLLWYWQADRTDNPWYPSVRLFRQGSAGDWT
ncbi:MAG: hypothetical protein RL477_97, partial [Pseudomonadota bacterium]